jgi:ankyrin repeat protein
MLQCGADPNEILDDQGNSFFHRFFWSCTSRAKSVYKIIDILIKHGANPNLFNKDNVTPLNYALQYVTQESSIQPKEVEQNRKSLCTLIDLCDNYGHQDIHGNTLLDYVKKNKNHHAEIIAYLQSKGIDQN